jgi:hypothetical protein
VMDVVIDRVIVRHRLVFPVGTGAFRHNGAAKQQISLPKARNGSRTERLTAAGAGNYGWTALAAKMVGE